MTRELFEWDRWNTSPMMSAIIVGAILAALAWTVWLTARECVDRPSWIRWLLTCFRVCLWSAVGAIILEPGCRRETRIRQPARVVVAVDTSLSMSLPTSSAENAPSRSSQAARIVRDLTLMEYLAGRQEVVLYRIGSRSEEIARWPANRKLSEPAEPTTSDETAPGKRSVGDVWRSDLGKLEPTDDSTRLGDGLTEILSANPSVPVAAILLVTDGQNNAGGGWEGPLQTLIDREIPVTAVGLGSLEQPANVRVSDFRVPSRAFLGDEVKGTAFVEATGLKDPTVSVEILLRPADANLAPRLIELQEITLPTDGEPVAVPFQWQADQAGPWQLTVQARPVASEIRTDDNAAVRSIDVVESKNKVLVIAGGPSREYRFLRSFLFRDDSIDASILLQTNPEEQSTGGDRMLAEAPASAEALFAYDVIIAIDPDWSALSPETVPLIQRWSSEQGGGLVLVAGPIHTPRTARDDPPTGARSLYPVELKQAFASDFEAGQYRQAVPVRLTREGQLAGLFKLHDDDALSSQWWGRFPGFYWNYPVDAVRPAASVLASNSTEEIVPGGADNPVVVGQFLGSGRVLYLGSGEFWRLRQLNEPAYGFLWTRIVRELSQGRLRQGSNRATILLDGDQFPLGSEIPLRAQILGPDFRPLVAPVVSLSVQSPSGENVSLALEPMENRPGTYEAPFVLHQPGSYRLQLLVPDTKEVVERRFNVDVPEREFAQPTMNRQGLTQLCEPTGGSLIAVEGVGPWASKIEDRTETRIERSPFEPAWDHRWLLGLIIAWASLEWLLRRQSNLA